MKPLTHLAYRRAVHRLTPLWRIGKPLNLIDAIGEVCSTAKFYRLTADEREMLFYQICGVFNIVILLSEKELSDKMASYDFYNRIPASGEL